MATTQNNYTGNGSNKLFSITFPYLDTADIDVYLNGTLQTVTTQYSFANATTIEFVTAPANGAAVRIDRSTDDSALQATFFPGSSIKAADLNADFDQTLYVVQEINNKAVKIDDPLYVDKTYVDNLALAAVPDGDRGDITVSGTGTVWSIDAGAIVNADINASAGIEATKLAFTQAGTGAVSRTIDSKFKDIVYAKDFGGTWDGTADDTAAVQRALDAVPTNSVLRIQGNIRLLQNVYLYNKSNVIIDFCGSNVSFASKNLILLSNCTNVSIINIGSATCTNTSTSSTNRPAGNTVAASYFDYAMCAYQCTRFTLQDCLINLAGALPVMVTQGSNNKIVNNVIGGGGDNSIYAFNTSDILVSGNIVKDTPQGRHICLHRLARATVTGNIVTGGAGFGIALVGASNSVVSSNTISNITQDTILSSKAGIAIEGNEAADLIAGEVTAANANLFLVYPTNSAYSRNNTVTGNTIIGTGIGIQVGVGPNGNYGINIISSNQIINVETGIQVITASGAHSLLSNSIKQCTNAGILVSGTVSNLRIASNILDTTNTSNTGYKAIHKGGSASIGTSVIIQANIYASAVRSNITVTEASYVSDWPETSALSVLTQGEATIIAADGGGLTADAVNFQNILDLTSYLSSTSLVHITFSMGQGDRHPIPMYLGTYNAANTTNYSINKTVSSTEDIRVSGNYLQVKLPNSGVLGYGAVWRAIVVINKP
jgi:parallel beta-helix repeat protein